MIDLQELMHERSAHQPPVDHLRLTNVRHKITARRRRRTAMLATGCVLLFTIIGGYLWKPALFRQTPSPPAATPTPTAVAFPSYELGRRLVRTATAPLAAGKVSLTWTPSPVQVTLVVACDPPKDAEVWFSYGLNDEEPTQFSNRCTGRGSMIVVAADKPTTLTAYVQRNIDDTRPIDPSITGSVTIGLYEDVPFDEYEFPPRPATLVPLPGSCRTTELVLRSDPADPLKPVSATMVWDVGFRQQLLSQGPARLDIIVNGTKVNTVTRWDYSGSWLHSWWSPTTAPQGWQPPKPGEIVTITIAPTRATGGWLTLFAASGAAPLAGGTGCGD